jgi:transposase
VQDSQNKIINRDTKTLIDKLLLEKIPLAGVARFVIVFYSLDLRERVVRAIETRDGSFRKVAQRFAVSKTCVERWVIQKRSQGHLVTRKQGDSLSALMNHQDQLMAIFEKHCDATGLWVSQSTMGRIFARLTLPRKKKHFAPLKPQVSACNCCA